uniref:Uncharacterized protein n=1 Tax=Arundo donax TaxID=35708 RepID=A0A0A9CDY5_ARUDO
MMLWSSGTVVCPLWYLRKAFLKT